MIDTKKVIVHKKGLISYDEGLLFQKKLFDLTVSKKISNRNNTIHQPTENYLILCQHPHTYTLGRSGEKNNLLINSEELKEKGATFHEIGRGGDITYHGPGQIVGYPIIDLDNFFTDIHKYLRFLEETVILTLADFNIVAGRIDGLTGVWLDHIEKKNPRKICAFGVKASRWVTMHGWALNVNTDLNYFNNIVPCGITDKAVTSMQHELGEKLDIESVESTLIKHFENLFEVQAVC